MEDQEKKDVSSLSKKNMEISIAEASMFPGFRFSPTDEELICHYLKKKVEGSDKCVEVIPEVDICADEPWDLPAKSIIRSDDEWFFFSSRGRKYPNGSQSKRATTCGYWKATGKERNVKSGSKVIGTKRTLVFHTGRAPKGQRTEWIMHEYCMSGRSQDLMVVCRLRKNSEFKLDVNPRRKSQQQGQSSALDNNAAASSGVEHSGVRGGTMVAECCSKEGSSSYNSHSIEQNDSSFESDDKVTNAISPHGSSSHWQIQEHDKNEEDCFANIMKDDIIKERDKNEEDWFADIMKDDIIKEHDKNEEDCFADIMKDDIIKLDESSLMSSSHLLPMDSREPETKITSEEPSQVTTTPLPCQGTANRRLKLRMSKPEIQDVKPLTEDKQKHDSSMNEFLSNKDLQMSLKNLIDLSSPMAIKLRAVLVFLMILLFLCLFTRVLVFLESNFTSHVNLKGP